MMLVGMIATIPLVAIASPPELTGGKAWLWLLSGVGNVLGLVITNYAFRIGKVGLVMPVVATEGAIAAVLAALLGESIAPIVAFLLTMIVIGVVVAASAPDPAPIEHERPVLAVILASIAAVGFGTSLFATGSLSDELDLGWLLLPARLVGIVAITIPLVLSRRLRITRRAMPLVIGSGLAEVAGFSAYTVAAQESVAVASVLASQFAPIGAIMAFLLFRERLGRLQILGVTILVVSVASLSIVSSLT